MPGGDLFIAGPRAMTRRINIRRMGWVWNLSHKYPKLVRALIRFQAKF